MRICIVFIVVAVILGEVSGNERKEFFCPLWQGMPQSVLFPDLSALCGSGFAMFYTQFYSGVNGPEVEPKQGESYYGTIAREVPEVLMPRAAESLLIEYLANSYVAYPIGFYKEIRLTETKRGEMADIICELTGFTREELDRFVRGIKGNHEKSGKNSFEIGEGNGDLGAGIWGRKHFPCRSTAFPKV